MKLLWDQVGEREYETGVDRGVLYLTDVAGQYNDGYAWNGLVTVTESPSGAEASPQYADNIKYLNLVAAEQFGGTIEAFTYPDEFSECDGTIELTPGVKLGQQPRKMFGLAYRSRVGNDVEGVEYGYKLHLVYGALAAPSEKAYGTINDSPAAITFSWAITTTPVDAGDNKPTALITVDSSKVDPGALASLEDMLYGTAGGDPRLPLPVEVLSLFTGTIVSVKTTAPTYVLATKTITVPVVPGVVYSIDGKPVTGVVVIAKDTVVTAAPAPGYEFDDLSDVDWSFRIV